MKGLLRNLVMLTVMFILLFMTLACGGGSSSSNSEIRISGSTSVSPVISKLAAEFERDNPEYTIIVESVGSSIGVRDTIDGNNNIGMASRGIKSDEAQSVDSIVLCNDAIVIIVNSAASLSQISKDGLFSFYMDNKALDDVTKPVSREDGSGTRSAFAELTGIGEKEALPQTVEILDSTGKIKTAVSNDEQKLGYISLGSLDDTVKALAYSEDGVSYVEPLVENVVNGTYALYRPFNLVVKKGVELSAGTKAFLDFCKTDEAKEIITDSGYIPL